MEGIFLPQIAGNFPYTAILPISWNCICIYEYIYVFVRVFLQLRGLIIWMFLLICNRLFCISAFTRVVS